MQTITVDAVSAHALQQTRVAQAFHARSSLTWTGQCRSSFTAPADPPSHARPRFSFPSAIAVRTRARRTLIDSTPGVLKAWDAFAAKYGFDAAEVAHAAHGRRLDDTLHEYAHLDDPAERTVSTADACDLPC